jgi:acetoacetate decarboxylase
VATSIPFVSPLYPDPPVEYSDARLAVAILEGPVPDAVVPQETEPSDPPMRLALFADYPESTIGPYREVAILVSVSFRGSQALYCPLIYVTTDVALCQGREVWGFPKKLAEIDLDLGDDSDAASCRVEARLARSGQVLLSLEGSPREEASPDAIASLAGLPVLNSKLIPAPTGKEPDVDCLTIVRPQYDLTRVLLGTGFLTASGEAASVLGRGGEVTLARLAGDMVLGAGETVT